ncbi:MAG: isopropylmalate/homocitrate/citramalate synthase [Myxococcaceae bacterium]|nr:isopropylmalate/homocitrate/citramalate synthase [Myxococcaceae bacterium]
MSAQILEAYYRSFNARDYNGMLELVADDVVHEINQGKREVGKDLFAAFLERMDRQYREQIADLVVLSEASGTRYATEYTVIGKYLQADQGMPPANGQRYELSAGAFFELDGDVIERVTVYYNLPEWLEQVRG